MALVFTKLPGANDRSITNAVPGLTRHGSAGVLRPLTGAALRLEERRQKWGIALEWASLVLGVTFLAAVLGRWLMQGIWSELDDVIFGGIWAGSAVVVHLGVFFAEALRGRDAPRALLGLGVFWVGMVVLWVL